MRRFDSAAIIMVLSTSFTVGSVEVAKAAQPIITAPYVLAPTVLYDVDYAVSHPATAGAVSTRAETIISIGLPFSVHVTKCFAQVAWYDWDGTSAGLSGNSPAGGDVLISGHTLEYVTTPTAASPAEFPPYIENVFRDKASDFEGHAEIRITCPSGVTPPKALRVDAHWVTAEPNPANPNTPERRYQPINITKKTGLVGY